MITLVVLTVSLTMAFASWCLFQWAIAKNEQKYEKYLDEFHG